jgi:hypothetical protein
MKQLRYFNVTMNRLRIDAKKENAKTPLYEYFCRECDKQQEK